MSGFPSLLKSATATEFGRGPRPEHAGVLKRAITVTEQHAYALTAGETSIDVVGTEIVTAIANNKIDLAVTIKVSRSNSHGICPCDVIHLRVSESPVSIGNQNVCLAWIKSITRRDIG